MIKKSTSSLPLQEQSPGQLSGPEGVSKMSSQINSVSTLTLTQVLANTEKKEALKFKKIIVAGPPRSGKSCFNNGIKGAIKDIPGAPYPYILAACPDGEGAWFQETMNNNPELAAKIKSEYKSNFTPEFVKRISESISNVGNENTPLNFIDIGGIISPENAEICKDANSAIILCGQTAIEAGLAAEWKKFFDSLGIPVIAEVYSDYKGAEDYIRGVGDDGVFRGSVHHLERGEDLKSRPTLRELAKHVLSFEKRDYKIEAILNNVNKMIIEWQKLLPDVKVILGGSLVSGLFVLDDKTNLIDVDLRFLHSGTLSESEVVNLISKIESITGLKYRKDINVSDWPNGESKGIQIEGQIKYPGIELPLDIEGCLRNDKYIGWAKFYKEVFSQEELDNFRKEKIKLREHKTAYKRLKQYMLEECKKRCLEKGLVSLELFDIPSVYNFGILDPRPIESSKQINIQMLEKATSGVLGLEMTLPEYLKHCTLGNIDPQHSEGDINRAAIDDAVNFPLPQEKVLMVTVRPDLDSIGAMAVLSLRQKGFDNRRMDFLDRVKEVSKSDTFNMGDWQPSVLPSRDNLDGDAIKKELSGLSAMVMDFKLPISERVKLMEKWLETGETPEKYNKEVQKSKEQLVDMLEKGEITYSIVANGAIAIVNSINIAGTKVGYALAPTVVVTNPKFSFQGSEPIIKHTVCQYKLGYVDLVAAVKELNSIEPGWGGSPTIIGSPQGASSIITQEELSKIISKHLLKKS